MGKQNVERKKGTANNPKHTASSVKHGGGVVMAWACMAVSRTGPLNFTDDLMYDDSSRIEFVRVQKYLAYQYSRKCHQIHWEVLHIASGQWPKTPCQFSQEIYKGKEMESLRLPESISRFKSNWTWISPSEEKSKGRNSPKQATLGIGCIKGNGKSISKDETKSLVISMCHRLTAVIVHKGSATK